VSLADFRTAQLLSSFSKLDEAREMPKFLTQLAVSFECVTDYSQIMGNLSFGDTLGSLVESLQESNVVIATGLREPFFGS
jgi:hypothetical protein